ncbi:hypothetical protein [Actinomyces sp. 432]|uniref:hypothetical protein n=1 Tax=Actinomyces sp. 432 TaxID=2057798 RepID=UPI00192A29BB|nr:hypothetical protein [Actinomyces sp. 432]
MRNNAEKHIRAVLDQAVDDIPFPITGMDFAGGSEFTQPRGGRVGGGPGHLLPPEAGRTRRTTRPPPESKNNHLVRRHAFYYRYDTDAEREVLNRLWVLVDAQANYLTPTKKPIGWGTDKEGKRKRLYDAPRTPLDRLLDTDVLTDKQKQELIAYRNQLNPAAITRRISELQDVLIALAKDKTDQLYLAQFPSVLPDVHKGIRIKKAS